MYYEFFHGLVSMKRKHVYMTMFSCLENLYTRPEESEVMHPSHSLDTPK